MNVLVAGGAGYIGSHAVKQLLAAGHRVAVADNLFRGHRRAVDSRPFFAKFRWPIRMDWFESSANRRSIVSCTSPPWPMWVSRLPSR